MTNSEFIQTVGALAQKDTRILPSLTIAQAILESGWGKSGLTVNANALFGIKATAAWTGKVYSTTTKECYDGVSYTTETAVFRAYDSWAASVEDHTAFLCGLSRYSAVVGETDYRTACKAIHTAGYATDPDYADKLISLIEQYTLTDYDVTSSTAAKTVDELAQEVIAGKWGNGTARRTALTQAGYDYAAVQARVNELLGACTGTTYTVKAGDTLTAIAKAYGTTVAAIAAKNGIADVNKIYVGQVLSL